MRILQQSYVTRFRPTAFSWFQGNTETQAAADENGRASVAQCHEQESSKNQPETVPPQEWVNS